MRPDDAAFAARGRVGHAVAVLSPVAATAGRVALQRDVGLRGRRLLSAGMDRVSQRLRPTRPSMRSLVVRPGGRLEWRGVPAPPPPGPSEAVVTPLAVATCDLDRPLALGATPFPLPLRLGHECVAEVLSVGEYVRSVRPGQRVVVPFQISCGACPPCRSRRTASCTAVPPLSMYGFGLGGGHWGGAFDDQIAVPYADAMLVPLPAQVPADAAASAADTASDAYRHVAPHLPRLLAEDPGARVLIVGAQHERWPLSASTALFAGLIATALGGSRVALADARPAVRAAAAGLGLTPLTPRELRRSAPAQLVVDVSGDARGLAVALSATAPDGTCSSAGGLFRTARLPYARLYGRGVTVHLGRSSARANLPAVLRLMAAGQLPLDRVTDGRGRLDDAPRVLHEHLRSGATKTVITA